MSEQTGPEINISSPQLEGGGPIEDSAHSTLGGIAEGTLTLNDLSTPARLSGRLDHPFIDNPSKAAVDEDKTSLPKPKGDETATPDQTNLGGEPGADGTTAPGTENSSPKPAGTETVTSGQPHSEGESQKNGTAVNPLENPETKAAVSPQPGETRKSEVENGAQPYLTPEEIKIRDELKAKIETGQATKDEILRYQELKKRPDPKTLRKDLTDKALSGSITPEEAQILEKLNQQEQRNQQGRKELTPEEVTKIQEQISNLYLESLNPNLSPKELAEKINKIQELADQARGITLSEQDKEHSREFAEALIDPEKYGPSKLSQKEREIQRDIQDKIMQLRALEKRLLTQKKRIESLKKAKSDLIGQLRGKDAGALETMNQAERERVYAQYLQLNNVHAQLQVVKHETRIVAMQRRDTMQYIRRKLGVTHGLQAFFEFGSAMVTNILVEIDMAVEDKLSFAEEASLRNYFGF